MHVYNPLLIKVRCAFVTCNLPRAHYYWVLAVFPWSTLHSVLSSVPYRGTDSASMPQYGKISAAECLLWREQGALAPSANLAVRHEPVRQLNLAPHQGVAGLVATSFWKLPYTPPLTLIHITYFFFFCCWLHLPQHCYGFALITDIFFEGSSMLRSSKTLHVQSKMDAARKQL